MAHNDLYLAWLNDAYGLENSLIPILENHAKDARDHPQMHTKIEEHLAKTRHHAEMVKSCIERLGGHTSAVKTGLSTIMGNVQSISTGSAEDELVKNGLADFTAENFEIASYKALITAAESLQDQETLRACQQILADEQDMAQWLDQHLPMAVTEALQQKIAAHT